MDTRKSARFPIPADTLIVLFSPGDDNPVLIGSLIDFSQTGLAFAYLPFESNPKLPSSVCCNMWLQSYGLKGHTIYETVLSGESYFLCPRMRCGIQFATPLSNSELHYFKTLVFI